MRVAFQHADPAHANHGVAAYRLGRVQPHTDPLTGDTTSADEIMVALLDRCRAEFPEADGYDVWPECLSEPDETGESHWGPLDETALRARAAGEPVEVPVVSDLDVPQVRVAADQPQEAQA